MLSELSGWISRNSVFLLLGCSLGPELLQAQVFPNSDCTGPYTTKLKKKKGEGVDDLTLSIYDSILRLILPYSRII